jgi:hypothetical protein
MHNNSAMLNFQRIPPQPATAPMIVFSAERPLATGSFLTAWLGKRNLITTTGRS